MQIPAVLRRTLTCLPADLGDTVLSQPDGLRHDLTSGPLHVLSRQGRVHAGRQATPQRVAAWQPLVHVPVHAHALCGPLLEDAQRSLRLLHHAQYAVQHLRFMIVYRNWCGVENRAKYEYCDSWLVKCYR